MATSKQVSKKIQDQRNINNGEAMNKKKQADNVAKGKEINGKLAAKILRGKK